MVKTKLIIVGRYYLIHPLITAKEYFELLNYDVYFLPLLYYCQKYSGDELYNALYSFMMNINPQVMLWWNWECPSNILHKLKNNTHNILHCLFNWDHPYCLSELDNKKNRQITSKNIWDICFVSGDCKLDDYINSGSKESYYLRMFADEETHFPEKDKKYECDVSIVCTSMYDNETMYPDTIVSRKEIITNLIEANINVKIYGPESLKELFPNNYVHFTHFMDNHKVFSNSKINLCTHVTNGNKYFNERVGTILSSGGLLFCDKVDGIDKVLTNEENCIFIDPNNYVNQVKDILANYDINDNNNKYEIIKQNGIKIAKLKFSPSKWTQFIDSKIKNYLNNYPSKEIITNEQTYTFENPYPKKISIVMTYYNRIQQLTHTLDTINESKYPMDLIEVICYDDRSDIEPLILDTSNYNYNIKIIYGNYERDETIINPTFSFNNAFKYITGEYVIIQNSECMHIGDIVSYVGNNINENKLISFECWATGNEELSKKMYDNRNNKEIITNIIDNNWTQLIGYDVELKGWYNHKTLRPECLHFCNSMHINTFKKVGIFNTKLCTLLGFDDNEYAQRIMFKYNIDLEIPENNYELFAVHQNHENINKPREYCTFLNSRDKYFNIINLNINSYNKNINAIDNNSIIKIKYSDITNNDTFIYNLTDKWSTIIILLIIDVEYKKLNISFLRKCLKESNVRLNI